MDVKLTDKQAEFIENITKQQSNSLLWKDMVLAELQPPSYMMFQI